MRDGIDVSKIISVKIDEDNRRSKPDFSQTGYIFWEDSKYFAGGMYDTYTSMIEIEDKFGRESYIYRQAINIFSSNKDIRQIIVGYVDKYLGDIVDTK